MKRRLVIISYDGGEENLLPDLQYDINNYISFFSMPEAGAWDKEEIRYLISPSISKLENRFKTWRILGIEFYVIIFTGHGYCDERRNRYIQLNDEEDYAVEQLKTLVGEKSRSLFISDSCGTVWTPAQEAIQDSIQEQREFSSGDVNYRGICRFKYEERLSDIPEGTFMEVYSSAFDEGALYDEDKYHSIYSYFLLKAARERIKEKRTMKKTTPFYREYTSFTFIHEIAKRTVQNITKGKQNPVCVIEKGVQFPFLVVPKVSSRIL